MKRGVRLGIFQNLKKAVGQKDDSKTLNFPSVIDEGVKPADVTEKQAVEIKPFKQEPKPEEDSIEIAPRELPDLPGDGFFLHLYGELKEGKLSKDSVSTQDLVRSMQEYWHNDASMIKHKSKTEQNKWLIERSLSEAMERLTMLEQQWKMNRIKIERLKVDIETIESNIASESTKFKELVRKLKFHQPVPDDQAFKLFSGREVKSLNELLGALKIMDDMSFGNHVNAERNDFADWVENALKEKQIADQMRSVPSRDELIKFIERAVSHEPSA